MANQRIEDMWFEYATACGIPMGGVQWTETRRAFYAGAFSLLTAQRLAPALDSGEDDSVGVAWLQSIDEECKAFMLREMAR